ncbi:MAG: response regulator [Opitutales bacterium]
MEQPSKGHHILVAEDDPVMVKLLEFTLMREGYTVSVCREGDTVVDKARRENPDLLLVDYILPGMTGDQVAKAFQEDDELSKIPIIVVTGQGRESIRNKMLDIGVQEVFTKPFSPITLMADIKKYLR